jgi:hypothetical protein
VSDDNTDQSTLAIPAPEPELKRLDPLVGTWRAEEQTEDGVPGLGVPVTSVESFHRFDGGCYLVRTYETSLGDDPPQKGLNYWFYDSEAKRFRIILFSNNGPFSGHGNRYEGEVADGKLTFEELARFQYERDGRGRSRSGRMLDRGRLWLRDESGEWSHRG